MGETQAGGQKGRGLGGRNFCPPAEAKPRRPARSEQSPAKKFSFPFRKRNRAPNQKMRRKLFCGTASGGGAERSNFAVRIFVKKSSDFNQKAPPSPAIAGFGGRSPPEECDGGAGLLSWGFAQKMFELRPKNTAEK